MKKIIFAALALSTVISTAAYAVNDPLAYRRTLFMSIGQKNIILEAPQGMCFLDDTDEAQNGILSFLKSSTAHAGQGQLAAVFTDCLHLSAMAAGQADFSTVDKGTITWMNPYIGETTGRTKTDYIDTREATLRAYITQGLKSYPSANIDEKVHRTPHSAAIAYNIPMEMDYQKLTANGVTAAMTLKGYPIDITITRMSKKGGLNSSILYKMMDEFTEQQAILNNE